MSYKRRCCLEVARYVTICIAQIWPQTNSAIYCCNKDKMLIAIRCLCGKFVSQINYSFADWSIWNSFPFLLLLSVTAVTFHNYLYDKLNFMVWLPASWCFLLYTLILFFSIVRSKSQEVQCRSFHNYLYSASHIYYHKHHIRMSTFTQIPNKWMVWANMTDLLAENIQSRGLDYKFIFACHLCPYQTDMSYTNGKVDTLTLPMFAF